MEISSNLSNTNTSKSSFGRSWRLSLFICSVIIAIPILTVLASLSLPFSESWQHLFDTVLSDYVINSLFLMIGVGTGTLVLGVSAAWLGASRGVPGWRQSTGGKPAGGWPLSPRALESQSGTSP